MMALVSFEMISGIGKATTKHYLSIGFLLTNHTLIFVLSLLLSHKLSVSTTPNLDVPIKVVWRFIRTLMRIAPRQPIPTLACTMISRLVLYQLCRYNFYDIVPHHHLLVHFCFFSRSPSYSPLGRFHSIHARAVLLGLSKPTTMMPPRLLKSMTTLTITMDMIPSFAGRRINSRKIVDGDVNARWRNRVLAAVATTTRNVLGEDSKSSVFAFGVLRVSWRVYVWSSCTSVYLPIVSNRPLDSFQKQPIAVVLSVWLVLKQRRLMSREYAIVEEAAMNGVGLKKRHVFPISLGVVFFILLAMFMVWKKLTWILLIGTNVGLFAHFVYLRRKAKKAGNGGEGYIKDAGLEIS